MFDSAKALTNVASVNIFDTIEGPVAVYALHAQSIYLRLWQSDLKERYIPAAGATLQVKFPRAYTVGSTRATTPAADQSVTIAASNPYSNDTSIWKVDLTSSQADLVVGGGIQITLTEGATTRTFFLKDFVKKVTNAGG